MRLGQTITLRSTQILRSVLILLLCLTGTAVSAYEVDTARVREVRKPERSFSQVAGEIPGEILKLPVRTVRFMSHTIAFNPPVSWGTSLIKIGEQAQPYIPIVGYSTQSGLKFGLLLRKLKNIAPGDHIRGKLYYSTNEYQSYQIQLRHEEFFSDYLGLDLYFRYKKRPRERFHGVGNTSRKDDEACYTLENTEFRIETPYHPSERLYFSALARYLATNLADGRHPDLNGNLDSIFVDPNFALDPGRLSGSRYAVAGASFEWDGRNNRGRPSAGSQIITVFSRYFGIDRSDGQNFNEYSLDLRHYQHIWLQRVLAFRFFLKRVDADGADTLAMPVYLTSSLGGVDALRGYTERRFTDNDAAVASIEYRYPVWTMADAFVFLDEGRVFREITDERFFSGWKWSAGFGLRIWSHDEVIAMFQIARSDESTKVYFEFGAEW